jgi:hypothetical protein
MLTAMRKNLETADAIAKLVLAGGTIVLFFAGVIAGPFADLLAILSAAIIVIFVVKVISERLTARRNAADDHD